MNFQKTLGIRLLERIDLDMIFIVLEGILKEEMNVNGLVLSKLIVFNK